MRESIRFGFLTTEVVHEQAQFPLIRFPQLMVSTESCAIRSDTNSTIPLAVIMLRSDGELLSHFS
ncbi:hypothetical protein D3C73_709900 [compost metagenome]